MRTKPISIFILLLFMIASMITFVCLTGCSEQDFAKFDNAADVAAQTAQGAEAVLNSPAGDLIPQPVKGIVRLGIEAIIGLGGLYAANKARIRGAVLRSVVQAVDATGDTKEAVKSNLQAAGIEAKGRQIIAGYKVSTSKEVV